MDLRGLRSGASPLPCKHGQISAPGRLCDTQMHLSRMNMPFFSGMISLPHVDSVWLVLRDNHILTCFLMFVHSDQCSRHWSNLGYASLCSAKIGPSVEYHFAFFLISFLLALVHVSPHLDSEFGILFLLVTHWTAPRSTKVSPSSRHFPLERFPDCK